jgi:cell division septum initiation protein DivIVA
MLASTEIPARKLRRRFGGYRRSDVEAVFGEIAAGSRSVSDECAILRDRLGTLEADLGERRKLDARIRKILVAAHRDLERRRRETRVEADAILATAHESTAKAGESSREERARLVALIDGMHELEQELRASARAVILEALRRLDADDAAELAVEAPPEPVVEEPEPSELPVTPEPAVTLKPEPSPAVEPAAEPSVDEDTLPVEPVPVPSRAHGKRSILLSLAILAVGAGIAIGIWQLADRDEGARSAPQASSVEPITAEPAPPQATGSGPPVTAETPPVDEAVPPVPRKAKLALRAAGGDCWVSVRARSANGGLLYEGFLYAGEARTFVARRLWLRVGNPANLEATLNGTGVDLPSGTADLIVTRTRVRTVALG